MATLNDIAIKLTSLAQLNLTRGYTKAYKTGNLYDRVGSYNTPARVLGKTKLGKERLSKTKKLDTIEFSLTYNPPGAEYGKFIEEGTRYIQPPRPFAEEAINSPQIERMIDQYMGVYIEDNVISGIMDELDTMESEY